MSRIKREGPPGSGPGNAQSKFDTNPAEDTAPPPPAQALRPWREVLQVHPAAELFPLMAPDELKELADDVKSNGLRERVDLWRDTDGTVVLLDGRNRLDALE